MKEGIRIECVVCGRTKKPHGRSAPLGTYMCDSDCPGYYEDPQIGSLWPGETDQDFGYPVGEFGWKEVL